jgi:hypothetical protein
VLPDGAKPQVLTYSGRAERVALVLAMLRWNVDAGS